VVSAQVISIKSTISLMGENMAPALLIRQRGGGPPLLISPPPAGPRPPRRGRPGKSTSGLLPYLRIFEAVRLGPGPIFPPDKDDPGPLPGSSSAATRRSRVAPVTEDRLARHGFDELRHTVRRFRGLVWAP